MSPVTQGMITLEKIPSPNNFQSDIKEPMGLEINRMATVPASLVAVPIGPGCIIPYQPCNLYSFHSHQLPSCYLTIHQPSTTTDNHEPTINNPLINHSSNIPKTTVRSFFAQKQQQKKLDLPCSTSCVRGVCDDNRLVFTMTRHTTAMSGGHPAAGRYWKPITH